jgi:hypothetical protein
MSGGCMQTLNFASRHQCSRLFRRVFERLSIGRLIDHFQRALLYLDLFGPPSCAMIGLLLLIPSFEQGTHSGAEKGGI